MKLARMLHVRIFCQVLQAVSHPTDATTMLPTFMPVATQAAIKGLTAEQVESLGVSLILNNTYHLNLRPGLEVLKAAGGAHKFQGWKRNLLTVGFVPQARNYIDGTFRIVVAFNSCLSANSQPSQRKARCSRALSLVNLLC